MNAKLLAALALAALLVGLLWWMGSGGGEPPGPRSADAQDPQAGAHPPGDVFAAVARSSPPDPPGSVAPAPDLAGPSAASGVILARIEARGTLVREPSVRVRAAGSDADVDWVQVAEARRFDALPAGAWTVETHGLGWAAQPAEVMLRAGDEAVVTLVPQSVLEGLVLGGGSPLPRATLDVQAHSPRGGQQSIDISASVFQGEVELQGGAFRLLGWELPSGDFRFRTLEICARAPGWFEGRSQLLLGDTLRLSGAVVELRGALLGGRVLAPDEAGVQPVAGAAVLLVAPSTRAQDFVFVDGLPQAVDERGRSIGPLAVTATDERGEFRFPTLDGQPATFGARLFVVADGWLPWLGGSLAIDQRVAPGWHEVTLQPGATLTGTLRVRLVPASDPAAAPEPAAQPRTVLLQPLAEAAHSLRATRSLVPRRSPMPDDPDHARWEFEARGLPPGRWRATAQLDVAPPDGAPVLAPQALLQELDLAAGAQTRVTFTWPPETGATLSGSVRLPEGFEPELAEVALVPDGAWTLPVAGAPLRADGRFELAGVPPGAWAAFAFARAAGRLALTSWPVTVGAGTPPPLRLDASRPEVRVRVAEALRDRRLLLTGTTGDAAFDTYLALGRTHLDPAPDGEARFFGLLPGRYRLAVASMPGPGLEFELPPGRDVVHVDID